MATKRALVLAVVLVIAAACAGRQFVRPPAESLVVGKTTFTEIRERFGSPYREGSVVKNEVMLKTAVYAYAAGGQSLVGGVTPARAQGFYFSNDVLVGHEFVSFFAEDHTDFDETKVSGVKKGVTTRGQIVELFGKPNGFYSYPLIKDRDATGMVYLYSHTKGSAFNLKFHQKQLVVSVDSNDVVTEVEFTSSGQR